MKNLKIIDFMIYWSIIVMPFSVAIAPGVANTFIGIFSVFYILKKLIKKELPKIDKWVIFFFSCIIIFSLVSFINSVSYRSSFQGVTKLLKYLLILLVCSEEIKDIKHIKRVTISICCAIVLVSVDALFQFFFGYDFIHRIALHHNIGLPRASAAFPNPNILGIYLSALTPLAAGLAILYFKGKQRLLAIFPAILGLIGIYLSFSRGAGLAVYVAILFLAIIGKRRWLLAALICMLLAFPFVMPENIREWAKKINYNPVVFMCNEDRLSIYANTVNMIKHHPFIGVGVNTFSKNYGKYKLPSAEKFWQTPDTIYAHNIYLQMAGEIGLLGLFSFLCLLFVIFRRVTGFVLRVNNEYLKITATGLAACLIAFLINGLTETSLYYSRVSMIFWYLIGFSLALNKFTNEAKSAN